jgi:hypothetical protein
MGIETAASMANQINNQLNSRDLDADLMIAIVLTKSGKPVRSATELFYPGEEAQASAVVVAKAQELGYSDVIVKTEIFNWYNLDWKKLPWIIPQGCDLDDWLDLTQWERYAISAGLNPGDHIREADREYRSDKVSLKLWNIRFASRN